MTLLFPGVEDKDSDQAEGLQRGLQSPGNMRRKVHSPHQEMAQSIELTDTENLLANTRMPTFPFLLVQQDSSILTNRKC